MSLLSSLLAKGERKTGATKQRSNPHRYNSVYSGPRNKGLIAIPHCTGRKGLGTTAGSTENTPAASDRKWALLQHLVALRDDYADEFSCKDRLNFSK